MIDKQNTRAILIGVSQFRDPYFIDASPIKNNASDLKKYLMDESILGLPESQILLLNQNRSDGEILDKIEQFLKNTWGDTLIFYFAGHGFKAPTGEFFLVTNNTSLKRVPKSSISWQEIKKLFETGGFGIQQRFYILDACHSGAATLGGEETLEIAEGSALLAAAKASKKAYFDENDKYTHFTAALLETLDEGVRNLGKPALSVQALFDKMNTKLQGKNFDLEKKTTDRINEVNFFLNKSFDEVALLLKEGDDFFDKSEYQTAISKYAKALVICNKKKDYTQADQITAKIDKATDYQKVIEKSRRNAQKDVGAVPPPKYQETKIENTFGKTSPNLGKKTTEITKPKDEKDPKPVFDFKKLLIPFIFLIVGIVGWQVWKASQVPQDNDLLTFQKAKRTNTEEAYSKYLKIYPKGDSVSSAKELLYALQHPTEDEGTVMTTEDTQTDNNKKKEELLWKDVVKKNTKKAYEKYLYNYKNGKYAKEAQAKIIELEKAERSKENTSSLLPKIDMVHVKGGTFQMGSNDGGDDEKPIHTVKLSSFQIGKYEVTQKLWKAVMGANPSIFKGDNLPVENVSWDDIQKFLKKLNQMTGKKYRLPTEAEWEFAARGGNKSKNYKYSGSNTIGNVAWMRDNSGSKTYNVGGKSPNELGIYDMTGNVWEWCSDWYGDYSSSNQTNPKGAASGEERVLRGGSWNYDSSSCRVANRNNLNPTNRININGFRVASSSR